jgi:hypothetical protein
MPSLHVAWATWVALTMLSQRVPGWLQRASVVHVGTTTAVIVMTGNHWFLDAAAGLALAVSVEVAVRAAFRAYRRRTAGEPAREPISARAG